MIAESQAILGGQIHNVEIPRGSTCLLIGMNTHFFPQAHTQRACSASRGCCCGRCEVQSGAPLGLRVFVPLSWALLPSDDGPIVCASSRPAPFRPADKAPFHKTEAGEEGGRERMVWKGKGDGKAACSRKG